MATAFITWMTWYAVATSSRSQTGAVTSGCRSAGKSACTPRTSGWPVVASERPSSEYMYSSGKYIGVSRRKATSARTSVLNATSVQPACHAATRGSASGRGRATDRCMHPISALQSA
jgi:hypothetical protein